MRLRTSTVLMLVLVVAIAGAANAMTMNTGVSGTVEYMVWGDAASDAIEQMVIDAFEAKYPNVDVVLRKPAGNYFEQLLTSIAAGTPPDIAIVDFYDLPNLIQAGLGQDVTAWAERDMVIAELESQLHPAAIDEMRLDGKLYSVANLRIGIDGLFYNKTMFDEGAVPLPAQGGAWTIDDWKEAAVRLTRSVNGDVSQWGIHFHEFFIWPFVRMNGGSLLTEDQTRVAFDRPEAYTALQELADLDLESNAIVWSFERRNAFEEGVAATHIMWVGGIVNWLRNNATWEWDIAPIPAGKLGSIGTIKGNPVIIPTTANNKEAAWEFMKFLGSEEAYTIYGLQGRFFPMHRGALQQVLEGSQGLSPAHLGEVMSWTAMPLPFVPGFREAQNMWLEELRPVWLGESSARLAGETIAQRSVGILASAKQ